MIGNQSTSVGGVCGRIHSFRTRHKIGRTIYVDESSNTKGSAIGIILENVEGVEIEYSLKFDFPTSNNLVKYEACLAQFRMAKEMGRPKLPSV